jgi:hypothetical protein
MGMHLAGLGICTLYPWDGMLSAKCFAMPPFSRNAVKCMAKYFASVRDAFRQKGVCGRPLPKNGTCGCLLPPQIFF